MERRRKLKIKYLTPKKPGNLKNKKIIKLKIRNDVKRGNKFS